MRPSVAMQSFGILATACSFDIESSKQGAFHTTSWFTGASCCGCRARVPATIGELDARSAAITIRLMASKSSR